MNIEIGGLKILTESYDFRNRLKNRKESNQVKILYRVVLEDKSLQRSSPSRNQVDNNKLETKISFQELRVVSQRGILSDIYMIPSKEEVIVEKARKQQTTIYLPTYRVRLVVEGEFDKIQLLIQTIQQTSSMRIIAPRPQAKEAPCPLRSESLSLPKDTIFSPLQVENDKENCINRRIEDENSFKSIKEKLKFSDLSDSVLQPEPTGFTPKLKRSNRLSSSPSLITSSQNNEDDTVDLDDVAVNIFPFTMTQINQQHITLQTTNTQPTHVNKEKSNISRPQPVPLLSSSVVQPAQPVAVGKVIRNLSQEMDFRKEIELSPEQEDLLKRCIAGESLFVTGGGGSGKSTLLKRVIERCVGRDGAEAVYVTATTGLAAFAIGGITIHQYLSLPIIDFEEDNSADVISATIEKVIEKGSVVQRCQQTKVLIIDEVSMLDPKLFEMIHEILQRTRQRFDLPFGGIQLIACGDFFQLPPIRASTSSSTTSMKKGLVTSFLKPPQHTACNSQERMRYCFESRLWKELFEHHSYELLTIHRQSNDSEYLSLLNHLRFGVTTEEELQQINNTCYQRKLQPEHDVMPTQIFTHKKDVDLVNQKNLAALKGKSMEFMSADSGEEAYVRSFQSICPVKKQLSVKIGAQVILVKTIDTLQGLVNGARGVVVRFARETNCPVVKFENGEEHTIRQAEFVLRIGGKTVARRLQIPLELSWAISVHKAQGITVNQAELHLENAFEYGQIYVAMSRVKKLNGVSLRSIIPKKKIACDPKVLSYYEKTFHKKP